MTRYRFNERTAQLIEGDILDAAGQPVDVSRLTAATLMLYDLDTYVPGASPAEGVINSRDQQDALNAHDVAIDADSPATVGHFVWSVQPADNIIVTPRRQIERHIAELTFTWDSGEFVYACELDVVNLRSVS